MEAYSVRHRRDSTELSVVLRGRYVWFRGSKIFILIRVSLEVKMQDLLQGLVSRYDS